MEFGGAGQVVDESVVFIESESMFAFSCLFIKFRKGFVQENTLIWHDMILINHKAEILPKYSLT